MPPGAPEKKSLMNAGASFHRRGKRLSLQLGAFFGPNNEPVYFPFSVLSEWRLHLQVARTKWIAL